MKRSMALLLLLGATGGIADAQRVPLDRTSVVATVTGLKPGQYVWAPAVAPAGPMLLIVNVRTQRAVLYRNGIPIGATTVSTGRPGFETPTGVFTILQKHVEHYSTKYDNAPMPFMQRLTWRGVALHAGQLPGRPASHGCITCRATSPACCLASPRLG
jgi:lipoprotein-anchoring transpeptidase ErfK/SrfK